MSSLLVPKFELEHVAYIDFETFYDQKFSLRKLTTSEYVRSTLFETLMVGVKLDGGESVLFEHDEFREWSASQDWSKTAICAHNARFESLVLAHHYNVFPGFWFDTLSMSRPLGLPGSLKALSEHFGVGVKGDELANMKGKRRKDFTSEEFAAAGLYCLQDVDLDAAIFDKMSEGFPEPELWLIDSTIRMFSEPKLLLDEPMLQAYMIEEAERKAGLLAQCGLDKKSVGSNEKLADAFRQLGVEPPVKMSPTTKKEVYAFAKDDVGMMALLEHEVDEVRWLAEARLAIKSTINSSRGARFLKLGENGQLMCVGLNYAGAHTWRWSGSEKANFQNLERTNKRDPKKGRLKKSLIAPSEYKVVAVDSGAIEARGAAFLSEHATMVEAFAQNRDVYSEFASVVYGRTIDRKKNPEDETPGFVGKVAILGLGFGQGGVKLGENFLKGKSGPPVQFGMAEVKSMGVDIDKFLQDERKMKQVSKIITRLSPEDLVIHCAVTDHLVKKYRTSNKPIPMFWRFLGDVIRAMEEGIEGYFGPNDCLQTIKNGIVLPSGLTLHYPELRQSKKSDFVDEDGEDEDDSKDAWRRKGYSYFNGQHRTRLYGSLLLENIDQALARIIVSEQMLHVRATTGYRPVMGAHDEWTYVVPESDAHAFKNFVIETMKTPPAWAKGWPLNAEGGVGPSYGDLGK